MVTEDLSAGDRQGIIDALNKAVMHLYEQAKDCVNDPEFADLEDMYKGDASDHEGILERFIAGDYKSAARQFQYMDTASRDNVFAFFQSKQHERAFIYFLENS